MKLNELRVGDLIVINDREETTYIAETSNISSSGWSELFVFPKTHGHRRRVLYVPSDGVPDHWNIFRDGYKVF